jgi:hypothetical protein
MVPANKMICCTPATDICTSAWRMRVSPSRAVLVASAAIACFVASSTSAAWVADITIELRNESNSTACRVPSAEIDHAPRVAAICTATAVA